MATEVIREAEYAALRATIRERGTARFLIVPFTFTAWAATAIAAATVITVATGTLVPLLVLAAGFEAVYSLHTNVERIGRYIQVFHEPAGGWEHVAMAFGTRFAGAGPDPLFGRLFAAAVVVNYLPAALGGTTLELAVLAALHLLIINRIRVARSSSARQRAADLDRFRAIAEA